MEEVKLPEGAEVADDQMMEEMMSRSAQQPLELSPKELKALQRAARRFARNSMTTSNFTKKQLTADQRKKKRKLQKQARKKQRK